MSNEETTASLLRQGAQLQQQGKLREARAVYHWVLQEQPNNPVALQLTGSLALEIDSFEIAESMLRRALEISPDFADAHYNLGQLLQRRYQFSEAEKHFRSVLAVQPAHADALSSMSEVLRALGRSEEAAEYAEACALLYPDRVKA